MKIILSNTEWKLMNRLWESPPMTITMLTKALAEDEGWTKQTIITMLTRLEVKGAVYYERDERAKQYYPAIDRNEAQRAETKSFLDRIYGGSLGLMVNTLVDSRALSKEDIEELSEILKKAGEKL